MEIMLKNKCCLYVIISIRFFQSRFVTYLPNRPRICVIIIIIIITPQFSVHSVAAVPISVQTKQITINIHKEQHKTQYKQHKTHSITVHILTKHPHKPEPPNFVSSNIYFFCDLTLYWSVCCTGRFDGT